MRLLYKIQSVNVVYENDRCLFRDNYGTVSTLRGQQANFLCNVKQQVRLSVVDEMFAFLGDTQREMVLTHVGISYRSYCQGSSSQ